MDTEHKRPDAEASRNLLQSGGYEFQGKELEPFTPERQAVATEMGMKWPYVDAEDAVTVPMIVELTEEEFAALPKKKQTKANRTRTVPLAHYRQSFRDSVIALWLCSQPVSRVKRAGRKPDEASDEMWKWAEKINFSQGGEVAGEGLMLWIVITQQVHTSKSKPVNAETGDAPEVSEDPDL